MNRSAFTLIELMIATAIAVVMLGLLSATWISSSRAIARQQALTDLHMTASALDLRLADDVESMHPGAKVDLVVRTSAPNNPSIYQRPAADHIIRLTWMRTLESPDASNGMGQPGAHDLVWVRWEWRRFGIDDKPTLYRGMSAPVRRIGDNLQVPSSISGSQQDYRIQERFPMFRRDARRSLTDDGKLLRPYMYPGAGDPNFPGYDYNAPDGNDEDDLAIRMVPVNTSCDDFAVSWQDAGGAEVFAATDFAGANNGIIHRNLRRTTTGVLQAPEIWSASSYKATLDAYSVLGSHGKQHTGFSAGGTDLQVPWYVNRVIRPRFTWTSDRDELWSRYAVDGIWLDGRIWNQPFSGNLNFIWDFRTVQQRRPSVLRMAFTLSNDPNPSARSANWTVPTRDLTGLWLRQRFSFSHPCGIQAANP